MSKKYFGALAKALARVRPESIEIHKIAMLQWAIDVRAIAGTCRAYNDRFDYHRFIEACETWESK